jgi:hypothetical protein
MRRFTFAASFLATLAFCSFSSLQAHGPGGGHGGGGHGGGGHGEHGRPTFAGGTGGGGNSALNGLGNQNAGNRFLGGAGGLGNGALASQLGNGSTPLNGSSPLGINSGNPLNGNSTASIGRLMNGGLNNGLNNGFNNGAGLGGLLNGLSPQQRHEMEKQLLHKKLIEAHKLAQLAKQSNDPKLLAQAQQMAQQVEQQYVKQFGSLPSGTANNPGITINPANQGLNNTGSGNGFFPPGNLAGGNQGSHPAVSAKR